NDGSNLYAYTRSNPCIRVDTSGTAAYTSPNLHLVQQTELRQWVTATGSGYIPARVQAQYQGMARQWLLGDVHVGHEIPLALVPAGTNVRTFIQPAKENLSLGGSEDK